MLMMSNMTHSVALTGASLRWHGARKKLNSHFMSHIMNNKFIYGLLKTHKKAVKEKTIWK